MKVNISIASFVAMIFTLSIFVSCDIRKSDKQVAPVQQEKKKSSLAPTTVQLIDSVFDFGTIKEGDVVSFSYRFKNTGDKPLEVTNVMASCGCTVPEKPEEPIEPGQIGFIKVKFNSDRKPGEAHKTVTVESNANPEFPTLLLKGTVVGKSE
ncbi:MAG: hypothetical protein RIR96_1608 [Bacteroidota bacterium]|jgi:hypothetical protein